MIRYIPRKAKAIVLTISLALASFTTWAQNGPGGVGTSTDNVLWLRSTQGTSTTTNNNPVSDWSDISGNANHSAQVTVGLQPLFISSGMNGLPTLRFDGTNDFLVVPDADNLDNTTGVSVFVVAQPNTPDSQPRGLVSKRVDSGSERAYSLFTYSSSNLYFDAGSDRFNGSDAVTDQPQIFSAVFNGAVANPRSTIYYNGQESGSGNGPTSIGNMASNLHIGILNEGYAQGFQGDISEVIVYRKALNTAERVVVENYLSSRYDITLGDNYYTNTTYNHDVVGIGTTDGTIKQSETTSSGGGILLRELANSLDNTNEFVFSGHDGTAPAEVATDLPTLAEGNITGRSQRVWYVQKTTTDAIDASIGFELSETGLGEGEENQIFYLLFRSGTSGAFSTVSDAQGVLVNGEVWFSVNNADLVDGYYTIARSDKKGKTWYSYKSGNWNDHLTWTLDAGGDLVNGESLTPTTSPTAFSDRVVIKPNYVVTVTDNGIQNALLDVRSGGTVDFGTTTGHIFDAIIGDGTIKLSADNFPDGDASGFADASLGGTVEYSGAASYELSTPRTFRNMTINTDDPAHGVTILANYTLNGNLTVQTGELQLGNSTSTNNLDFSVLHHVLVETNGKILTGDATDTRHQFNLYGDFTIQGEVEFTNRVAANYTAEATDGIVDVNFLSATRNQNLMLEGPSRFYRIEVDKGTTSTYELYIEATDPSYFNLLGFANQGHPDIAQLVSNTNAFALLTGTVRVGANILIPRLNGSGNYNISENATLWVDGGEVTKPSGTAVVVYGKVKVSDGVFNAQINSGITTRLNGVLEVSGGTANLGQFRTSVYGTQHIGGFIQTGGTVNVNQAWGSSGSYYLFTLSYEGNVFTLTGGTLNIRGTNARGSIFINSDPVNQNVNANATLNLISYTTDLSRITSRAPLPTVNFMREGSGSRTFVLEGGITGTTAANQAVLPALPLVTKGTLTIEDNITFNPKGQNVTIGGDYSIGSGATYQAASNITTFAGATSSYSIDIHTDATTKYFHNLTVNNPGQNGTLSGSNITIHNNLTITAGTLAGADRDITVRGNITNSGTITNTTGNVILTERGIVSAISVGFSTPFSDIPTITIADPPPSVPPGITATAVPLFNGTPTVADPLPLIGILVTNSGSGYTTPPSVSIVGGGGMATTNVTTNTQHAIGGDGNGVFGNLVVDEEHPADLSQEVTYLTAKQAVTGTMTLANGIFDLKTHNLDVEGTLHNNTIAYYSNQRMFRTDGNHGDGGLTRTISADGTYLFPIGTINNDQNAYRYAWANPEFSNISTTGKVQINGVPRKLGTLSDDVAVNDRKYLLYYWRVRDKEFATLPDVRNQFLGYKDDVFGQSNWANIVPGKVVNNIRTLTGTLDVGNSNSPTGILDYDDISVLETGEFTAGRSQVFQGSIKVFYSKTNAASWYSDWWDNPNNWSAEPHTFTTAESRPNYPGDLVPGLGDIAIIGYGGHNDRGGYHSVNIRNAIEVGKIEFVPHPSPPADARISRVVINQAGANNGTLDAGIVEGPGIFQVYNYSTTPGAFPAINADFSEFILNDTAAFSFYPDGGVFHVIPNISGGVFPNLILEGGSATMDYDFIVRRNFTIHSNGDFTTNTGSEGDFQVLGDLQLGDYYGGTLSFNTTGVERTVELGGIRFNLDRHETSLRRIRVLNTTASDLQHRLIVNGDIFRDENDNNRLDLFTDNAGGNNVILEFAGEGNHSLTIDGSNASQFNFYKIEVNKGTSQASSFTFNNAFNLGGLTSGTTEEKSLQLQNGTLYLNHPDIDIDLSTGGEDFYIPSTSGLVIQQGEVNVSGDDSGILLDGLLRVEAGGTIDMDDAVGNGNNYIEYSSSGNAAIEVTGGALTVGSQIRRGTTNPSGVLRYEQTGGTVMVGKNAAPVGNRGTLELLNTDSRFIYTGGTLTVVRPQASATVPSVILEPGVGSADESTLQLGNADTPASSVISIKSALDLGNLTVSGGSTTAQLKDRSLVVKGDLTIAENCAFTGFDGDYRSLTVNRNIYNNGEANFNVDSLILRGIGTSPSAAMQEIHGEVIVRNLVVEPENSVTLQPSSPIEVEGNLYLNSGQLVDGGNTITVKGNVSNGASHASTNPSMGGLLFGGTDLQTISGTGQFGNVEIDKSAQEVRLLNSITLNSDLTLTNGILNIQNHRLALGNDAYVNGTGFGTAKMIISDGGFGDLGISKSLVTGAQNFILPLGVGSGTGAKYTPVDFNITANTSAGTMSVHPINQYHMTTEGCGDVLQYYWNMTSSGISGFEATVNFHFHPDDVVGTLADYYRARLEGDTWTKIAPDPLNNELVDDNRIEFTYGGVSNLNGDYTAGTDACIPNNVPVYYTISSGNWSDKTIWQREGGGTVPDGGPQGHIVRISSGHTVAMDRFRIRSYRTIITGRLEVGTQVGHHLGFVSGTGTLAMVNEKLYPGDYTEFLACGSGGTIEFGGAGTYTLPNIYSYNNLTIAGSGTKTLPNADITICGDLQIKNSVTLNTVGGKNIDLDGDLYKDNTAIFYAEYSGQRLRFYGTDLQVVDGTFTDVGNRLNNFYISNSTELQGPVNVRTYFAMYNNSVITTSDANMLTLMGSSYGLLSVSAGSYVNGPITISKSNGASQIFPIGKNGKKKVVEILNINHGSGSKYWKTEYFDSNLGAGYYDAANYDDPLKTISQSEYWTLNGPSGGTASVEFTLTGTSDVAAALGWADRGNLRIVRWNGSTSKWEEVGGTPSVSGSAIDNATIRTGSPISFDGTDQYFTLASVIPITIPTATFTSVDHSICELETTSLFVALSGDSPWEIKYTDGTTDSDWIAVSTSPYEIESLSPATTTTYTLTEVRTVVSLGVYTDGNIFGDPVTISVYPTPTIYNVTGGGEICGAGTGTIGLDGSDIGVTYELWFIDEGRTVQTQSGTGSALAFTNIVEVGTYEIRAYNTSRSACTAIMNGTAEISLCVGVFAEITNLITDATICEGEEVTFEITFSGTPPFTFTVENNYGESWTETTDGTLVGTGPYTFNYTVPDPPVWNAPDLPNVFTYTIISITDDNSVVGNIVGAGQSVNVWKIPETGPQFHIPNTFGE